MICITFFSILLITTQFYHFFYTHRQILMIDIQNTHISINNSVYQNVLINIGGWTIHGYKGGGWHPVIWKWEKHIPLFLCLHNKHTPLGSSIYQLTPNLAIFYPPCWQSADILDWRPLFATKNNVEKCFSHQFFLKRITFRDIFQ